MKKETAGKFIFVGLVALIPAYYLSSLMLFFLNNVALKTALQRYYPTLIIDALKQSYPHVYAAIGLSYVIAFAILGLLILIASMSKKASLHGDAAFAKLPDIRKAGLLDNKKAGGIIIGKYQNKLLKYFGAQFVAVIAPTRSGKGVGIVIPNLLEWQESAVVLDIKQECFEITSKYRKEILQQDVYLFNPFDEKTHCYNPLDYIDFESKTTEIDLVALAEIIYPSNDPKNDFWVSHARNLFCGLTLMLYDVLESDVPDFQTEKRKLGMNLASILKVKNGFAGQNLKDFVGACKAMADMGKTVLSQRALDRLDNFLSIESENTASGIEASFSASLSLFQNDVVAMATQKSDFDFRDLRKKKITIYLGITPDRLTSASLIINLFFSQLIQQNVKELPEKNKAIQYTCLLLMDEFTSMGRSEIFEKAISFMAGYKLRSLLIFQSKSQLENNVPLGYGRQGAKNILDNHACHIVYTPKAEDAEHISKMLGNTTVKNKSRGRSMGQSTSRSENVSDVARPLMLPQELQAISFEDEIIKIDAVNPIYCKKAFYFDDKYFIAKLKSVSPTLKKLKGMPKKQDFDHVYIAGETKVLF